MRLAPLLVLVATVAGTAHAKPRLRDVDLFEEPPEPCLSGKTWPIVERCLKKQGAVSSLFATDSARVVQVAVPNTPQASRLHLYRKSPEGWSRTNMNAATNATNELLGVTSLEAPGGAGVLVQIGSVTRQMISLDQTNVTTRAIVRRVMSTACMPDSWGCRVMITSCEAYIGGKVYWSFRGEVYWHPSLGLRIRGTADNAGLLCRPAPKLFDEPDQ